MRSKLQGKGSKEDPFFSGETGIKLYVRVARYLEKESEQGGDFWILVPKPGDNTPPNLTKANIWVKDGVVTHFAIYTRGYSAHVEKISKWALNRLVLPWWLRPVQDWYYLFF